MRIALFEGDGETIVVGLNEDDTPIDPDGTLFGKDSGRDIEEFAIEEIDFVGGQSLHIQALLASRVKG